MPMSILADAPVTTIIAVRELERSRTFYKSLLGLKHIPESLSGDGVLYACGQGTLLYIYVTQAEGAGYHPARFTVKDILATIRELTTLGIKFEQYDFPGMRTDRMV